MFTGAGTVMEIHTHGIPMNNPRDGIVNEVSGLNNIIKVSSDDLIDNRLSIIRRKLKKTALIAVFLVPIHFLLYHFNGRPL